MRRVAEMNFLNSLEMVLFAEKFAAMDCFCE